MEIHAGDVCLGDLHYENSIQLMGLMEMNGEDLKHWKDKSERRVFDVHRIRNQQAKGLHQRHLISCLGLDTMIEESI